MIPNWKKRYWVVPVSLAAAAIAAAIWFGGRERWEMFDLDADAALSEEQLKVWEDRMEKSPDMVELQYNLGCYYYRNGQYDKAKKRFHDIINTHKGGNRLQRAAFYNMGNTIFRLAEGTENIEQAISLYQQSLAHYRGGIEKEKQERRFLNRDVAVDPDMQYNYALTLKRIKILSDKLKNRQREAANQKELFQLLREIKREEAAISGQLSQLIEQEDGEETREIKETLLRRRQENLERLKRVKEKVAQLFSEPQSSLPNATGKSVAPGGGTI